MREQFYHFRIVKKRGWDGVSNLVPQGGVTVCARTDGNDVTFSYAVCSWKDNYNRALGRTIARGRQKTSGAHTYRYTKEPERHVVDLNAHTIADRESKRLLSVFDPSEHVLLRYPAPSQPVI
jgi:hypothetical protein